MRKVYIAFSSSRQVPIDNSTPRDLQIQDLSTINYAGTSIERAIRECDDALYWAPMRSALILRFSFDDNIELCWLDGDLPAMPIDKLVSQPSDLPTIAMLVAAVWLVASPQ